MSQGSSLRHSAIRENYDQTYFVIIIIYLLSVLGISHMSLIIVVLVLVTI